MSVVKFPESSMLGAEPWGGLGAAPVPRHLQNKYSKMNHQERGWLSSEGNDESKPSPPPEPSNDGPVAADPVSAICCEKAISLASA
jgi:hypothetical protein